MANDDKKRFMMMQRTFTTLRKATILRAFGDRDCWNVTPFMNIQVRIHRTNRSNGEYAWKITGPNLKKAKELLTEKGLHVAEGEDFLVVSNEKIQIS